MPRVSGVYSRPAGIDAVNGAVIESADYNLNVADVETDLNTPRPIVAGGTGASSADEALINLQAEKNKQVVTNYNSFSFVGGSFVSAPGATGAPTAGDYYVGTVLDYNSSSMIIEARNPAGASYTRVKSFTTGTWDPTWTLGTDSSKVAKAGDTMTGNLTLDNGVADGADIILRSQGFTPWNIDNNSGVLRMISGAVALSITPVSAGANSLVLQNGLASGVQVTLQSAGNPDWGFNNESGTFRLFSGGNVWLTAAPTTGVITLNSTVASSSPTTGALKISGGLGVVGAGRFGGVVDGSSAHFGAGGSGVASSKLEVAVSSAADVCLNVYQTGFSNIMLGSKSGNTSGFLTNAYTGAPIGDPAYSIELTNTGVTKLTNTTASTSLTTGALTVAGGVGVGGAIWTNGFNIDTAGNPQVAFYRSSILQSFINDNGGSINVYSNAAGTAGMYIAHGANAWTAISDARLPYKKTARPLSALDKLEHIQLYENEVNGKLELFGKAQELFQAFPHVVAKGDDDPDFTPTGMFDGKIWGVSYERLGLVALQAVKELQAQVKLLEDRIAALEAAK
jgi:hypothetical protein